MFTDPELQALYTQLVAWGTASPAEALAVGAAIEEIDILDLQERLTARTPADIALVYQQLLQGSYNHLRAFATQWEAQTGATYSPQYLDAAGYQAILACAHQGHKLRLQLGAPALPIDPQRRIDLWYPVADQPAGQRGPPDAAPPDREPQQLGVG